MEIEIWSDIACPWCYIGKRHLESALEGHPHAGSINVRWRAFELDPNAPSQASASASDYAGRLAAKYGMEHAQAVATLDQMTARAAGVGLDFHFERAQPGNTFDAHRVLHLAHARGGDSLQGELKERLLRAYFTDGAQVSDPEVLAGLAAETGLDPDAVRRVLASDDYAVEVRADERTAQEFGATGVPFFVIDRRYAVAGAQPAEALREVIDRAWAESHPAEQLTSVSTGPGGASCAGDSCAV